MERSDPNLVHTVITQQLSLNFERWGGRGDCQQRSIGESFGTDFLEEKSYPLQRPGRDGVKRNSGRESKRFCLMPARPGGNKGC